MHISWDILHLQPLSCECRAITCNLKWSKIYFGIFSGGKRMSLLVILPHILTIRITWIYWYVYLFAIYNNLSLYVFDILQVVLFSGWGARGWKLSISFYWYKCNINIIQVDLTGLWVLQVTLSSIYCTSREHIQRGAAITRSIFSNILRNDPP